MDKDFVTYYPYFFDFHYFYKLYRIGDKNQKFVISNPDLPKMEKKLKNSSECFTVNYILVHFKSVFFLFRKLGT